MKKRDISVVKRAARLAILTTTAIVSSAGWADNLNVLWVGAGDSSADTVIHSLANPGSGDPSTTVWNITDYSSGAITLSNYNVILVGGNGADGLSELYNGLGGTGANAVSIPTSRIMVTGQDADFHVTYSPGDANFNGPRGFIRDAVAWAGGGSNTGFVFLNPAWSSTTLDQLGLTGLGTMQCCGSENVIIPSQYANYPINTGLTSDGLSNWGQSSHATWTGIDPTLWTGINTTTDPNAFVTLVTASSAGSSAAGISTPPVQQLADIVTTDGSSLASMVGSSLTHRFDGGVLVLDTDPAGAFTLSGLGGALDSAGGARLVSGIISDDVAGTAGHLTISDSLGGGVVFLTGANTYTGGTTVLAGATLSIQDAAALGTGTLSLVGSPTVAATLDVTGDSTISNNIQVSGDPIFNIATGTTTTISGVISDGGSSGDVVVNNDGTSTGTLVLTANNTYTGGTIVDAGTLALSGAGTLGAASGATTVAGGTLDLGGTSQSQTSLTQSGGLVTNGTIAVDAYQMTGGTLDASGQVNAATSFDMQSGTANGVLGGTGALTKSSAGTVTLAGANTYTGGTFVNDGTLALSGAGNIATSSGVSAGSTGTFDISAATAPETIANLTGSGTVNLGSTALTLSNATGTFSGTIGGTGGLTVAGGATALTGANSYTGGTTIASGAALALGANTASGTIAGDVLDNGTLVVDHTDDLVLANNITGAGSLIKQNGDVVTLTGANTYSGGTTVSGGTLKGDTTSLQGAITNNAAVEFAQAADGTYAGAMSGTGSLTKSGAGTLTLTGNSAITGATTISGGKVALQGQLGTSTATVGNTATLGGTGTLGGNLVVAAGGTLSPGNSPGTLTVTGDVTFNAGANFVTEIDGRTYSAAGGAGSYDRLALSGATSTFNAGGTISPVLRGITGAATNTFTPAYGDKFTIVTAASIGSGTFSNIVQPAAVLPANVRFDVLYNAQSVQLVLTPDSFRALGLADGWLLNGISAATGLDAVRPQAGTGAGNLPSLFNGLYGLNRSQLGLAFQQISGEIHADALQAEAANIDLMRGTVDSAGEGPDNGEAGKPNLWTQILGRTAVAKQDGVATRYTDTASGFMTGLNFVHGKDTFGLAGGYLDGKVRNAIGSQANSTYGSMYLHGIKQLTRALSLSGSIGYAFGNTTTSRNLALATGNSTANSRSHFSSFNGDLKLRYEMLVAGKLKSHLFAGLIYNDLSYGPVREVNATDQGLELSLDSSKWTTVQSTVGGDMAFGLGKHAEFVVSAAWNHELNDAPTASRRVAMGPASWTVGAVTASGENLNVGANLAVHLSDRLTAGIGYQGMFDTQRYSTHRGNFTLGLKF